MAASAVVQRFQSKAETLQTRITKCEQRGPAPHLQPGRATASAIHCGCARQGASSGLPSSQLLRASEKAIGNIYASLPLQGLCTPRHSEGAGGSWASSAVSWWGGMQTWGRDPYMCKHSLFARSSQDCLLKQKVSNGLIPCLQVALVFLS